METIFLIGAKSIGNYGGFETFIKKMVEYFEEDNDLHFYVACKKNGQGYKDPRFIDKAIITSNDTFIYHKAECFQIHVPEFIGPAQAIYYDLKAIDEAIKIVKKNKISNFTIYIMACRIGPFFKGIVNKIHKLGGKVIIKPDGHEWLRSKWSSLVKKYWKISEELMVKYSDKIICDSLKIEEYINNEYHADNTIYIAYPEDSNSSVVEDNEWNKFINKFSIKSKGYYLVIGRFVPENNYETIINEFMKSNTNRDLVIVCNENKKLYNKLLSKYNFTDDKRIKFVGAVYNSDLLRKIREETYCYIHGHEVGGTNPSLLEALSSTSLNIVFDVGFNKEVADDSAFYWTKESRNLSKLIDYCDKLDDENIRTMSEKAKKRITDNYNSNLIFSKYKSAFIN